MEKRPSEVAAPCDCSASRTAFEMWYAEQYFDHPMPDEFDRFEDTNEGPSGVYRYGDVRLAWESWQGAISWMQNRILTNSAAND
jgi:hypothetical protein